MPKGDKYVDLTCYLESCGQDEIKLTFEQIANIVGDLPSSAHMHPAFWANADKGSSFSFGWQNAGFTAHANLRKKTVIFARGAQDRSVRQGKSILDVDMAIASIKKYHKTTVEGVHTRYRSWEHCYNAFRKNRDNLEQADYLCLHLACYLASWGMLRNSFLLNMDYRVHMPVIQVIQSNQYDSLFTNQYSSSMIPLVMRLSDEIQKAYGEKTVTDTLTTKILLGVCGCVPAYDRYFKSAAVKYKVCSGSWNEKSLVAVWDYFETHKHSFEKLRHELIFDGYMYPPMKLMDMCLWQIGFDEEILI